MKTQMQRAVRLACLALALGCAPAAQAVRSGTTASGVPYVSGGVSQGERVELHARRDVYSLWVTTAALRTGAFLAEVRVVVRDSHRSVVLDDRLDGPWLFVDLPTGRYEVEASLGDESQKRTTTIHPGDHHQILFYFATGDEVSPEQEATFPGNPYDGKRK
jgi:hypothetical protein